LADYIALGVVDGDKISEIVRKLSYYPTRFMTFATLLDLAYTHVVTRFVEDNRKGEGYPVIVLYSGGDDLAVYGKWDKVLDLLIQLSEKSKT
jgi:Predicted hydrolase of the HD superfamily (permuted catalytic motifs)